ncbi:MAG: zinc ribbon domain-containing protein [Thermoplasmata archaeon]
MPKKVKHEHYTAKDAKEDLKDVGGCLSCGLPMKRTQREIASELVEYCPDCKDQHGHLRSYEEVLERLAQHLMRTERVDRPKAEAAARTRMAELPAWKGFNYWFAERKVRKLERPIPPHGRDGYPNPQSPSGELEDEEHGDCQAGRSHRKGGQGQD